MFYAAICVLIRIYSKIMEGRAERTNQLVGKKKAKTKATSEITKPEVIMCIDSIDLYVLVLFGMLDLAIILCFVTEGVG